MSKELTLDGKVDRIINQEIWCCDSSLITDMQSQYPQSDITNQFYIDNVDNLYYTDAELIGFGYGDSEEDIQNAKDNGEDMKEIFEWWRVSDWLAEKLDNINEPVLRNHYGNWWGRTCTGQAIKLDGTLQQIVRELGE